MYNIVIAKALFTKNTLSCKQQVILILHDNDNPYFVSFGFTAYIFGDYGINDGQNHSEYVDGNRSIHPKTTLN